MKLPERISKRSVSFFENHIRADILFALSMIALAFFMFLPSAESVWCFNAVFFLLLLFRCGKARILPSIIVSLSIIFFALLSPEGKVLFYAGKFAITEGALRSGARKGGILSGMVIISQFALSPSLRLPGKVGSFFADVFSTFASLCQRRISIKPAHLIESIDALLLDISGAASDDTGTLNK